MRNIVQPKEPMLSDSLWLIHRHKDHYEAQSALLRARYTALWLVLAILLCVTIIALLWLK
jgi:hypothetical protein